MSPTPFPLIHAQLLVKRLLKLNPSSGPAFHYIYVLGEKTQCRNDTDRELPFRQESNFAWLSGGVDVPGSALTISYEHEGGEFDEAKLTTALYLPEVEAAEVMWCGLPPSPAEIAKTLTFSSITEGWTPVTLFPANSALPTYIHTLPTTRSPTAQVARINGPKHTTTYLIKALHEARRNKTEQEMVWMREASRITSGAHTELMRKMGKGEAKDEAEAESIFVAYCRKEGAKYQAYTPIVAAGAHAGTLHYVANDGPFPTTAPGLLLLVDAGGEFKNYAGDVTRCIPIGNGGRFTKECKDIYSLVLEMQEAAFTLVKPGGSYEEIQLLMHKTAIAGLLSLGILHSSSPTLTGQALIDAILASGLSNAFYPHGVGHLLGLDVHDVGGLPQGNSKDPLMRYLRLRVPLEEGFCVTVEPGIYFNEHLFAPFKNSPYVNHEVLDRYFYVGGVRIEDNLFITKDGFENMTTVVKSIEDVEKLTATS